MKKILLFLFIGISASAFAQEQPCIPPIVSLTPFDSICAGDSIFIFPTVTGGNIGITYKWSNGATTSGIYVDPINPTTYTVTVKNGCGDSGKATTTVTVVYPTMLACCNSNISLGDSVVLLAGGNSSSYQWSPPVHCLSPICDSVRVTPTVTTSYTVTGTNRQGCSTERILMVTVGPAAVPSISGTDFVNIYPNPSTTTFNITLDKKALLNFCDITGRVLFSEMENPGIITFGKELNPGLYFLFIDGKPAGKLEKF